VALLALNRPLMGREQADCKIMRTPGESVVEIRWKEEKEKSGLAVLRIAKIRCEWIFVY
jgi:hypothetical protein